MADQGRTAPDLLCLPTALRQVARSKDKKAAEPTFLSSRDAFERGETQAGFGGKFLRIVDAVWLGGAHVDLQCSR
jgi:hypothetical protein